jgi:TolB-like protein
MGKFFDELKRRNVVRVALAYIVVCWLVFQIGEILFSAFGAPDWVFKTVILLLAIGFPFALIFAWAFELTPEGIKKTRDVSVTTSVTASTGRKLDFVIIAALVAALGYFIWERQQPIDSAVSDVDSVAVLPTAETVGESVNEELEPRRSIAVIPFVNMSSDKEQEWFADGLTEEILNSLARTPDLLVAARTSSFTFKGSNENIQTIAASLGVDHILEGSVRRAGDRLRVTAQLVRAIDGFHLWSETYDRDVDDMIDIQENVAIEIANAMNTALDPEALAEMMSSGTSSVPAFEAYLQGMAVGESTFVTGDIYENLNARDAFERAIELDPEFSKAYWRLAAFWRNQMTINFIPSGITEMTPAEMLPLYVDAIDKAIAFEKDPVSKLMYRASKARTEFKYRQALRLNEEYLEQRPNDQGAQLLQLLLIADLDLHDKISETVSEYYERDGYDPVITGNSLTRLLYSGDMDLLGSFARNSVVRFGDNANVMYQAHRALLWVGDIDGASKVLPVILASDLPDDSRYLVLLRQACAESRIADATRLYTKANADFAGDASIIWLGHKIMGNDEDAVGTLMEFDARNDMLTMVAFLGYGSFDPRPYPNLMAVLELQGIERGDAIEIPYRCKRQESVGPRRS